MLVVAATPLLAQSQAESLYEEAAARAEELRRDMDAREPGDPAAPLLERVRVLVTTFRDISRLFPASESGDDALWEGASLAAEAYWHFGEERDRDTALGLIDELLTFYPMSRLLVPAAAEARRLAGAPALAASESSSSAVAREPAPRSPGETAEEPARAPASATQAAGSRSSPAAPVPPEVSPRTNAVGPPVEPASRAPAPPPVSAPASAPTTPRETAPPPVSAPASAHTAPRETAPPRPLPPAAPASGSTALLQSMRREVLPGVLRITLVLDREVSFYQERLKAPLRLFITLRNVVPSPALRGVTIPVRADDVLRQARVGLPVDGRTRVAIDLVRDVPYKVYTLEDPFRIVVDFERPRPPQEDARVTRTEPRRAGRAVQTAPRAATGAPANGAAAPSSGRPDGVSLSRQLGLGVARIAIDPGHGGEDPGAQTPGLTEASLVLDVALRLEALLREHPGVGVVLTRRDDSYVSLEERTAIANRAGADLFLSIHANASPDASARGVETYVLDFAADAQAEAIAARENAGSSRTLHALPDIVRAIAQHDRIDESRNFAASVQGALFDRLRTIDRDVRNLGVKQAPFVVLIGATMPSALAEISFLTNGREGDLLRTGDYRQAIAEALFAGIVRYQRSLERQPAVATR